MVVALLSICNRDELNDEDGGDLEHKRQVIRNKIKAVGKMAIVFKTLRKEKENIAELKNILGVNSLPAGTLQNGSDGIKEGLSIYLNVIIAIKTFEDAKRADSDNERLPPVGRGEKAPAPAAPIFGKRPVTPEKNGSNGRSHSPIQM